MRVWVAVEICMCDICRCITNVFMVNCYRKASNILTHYIQSRSRARKNKKLSVACLGFHKRHICIIFILNSTVNPMRFSITILRYSFLHPFISLLLFMLFCFLPLLVCVWEKKKKEVWRDLLSWSRRPPGDASIQDNKYHLGFT